MQNTYTAVIKENGKWWIGWIEEVPGVNCQESTHDELMKTLKITLKEALELNRQEALQAAKPNFSEEIVYV
ncbi:MAG: type II toxin-antitoxin system HicB family antitoxin [Candidatus Omnitrophota bacterium]